MSTSDKFPFLSSAHLERLALLSEELGEAQQTVGKILRHGYASRHPNGGPDNRENLETELGHVLFAVSLMNMNGDVSIEAIQSSSTRKEATVQQYLHHQVVFKGDGNAWLA